MKYVSITDIEKKQIRKYNEDQNFCVDCEKPINKRCHNSDIMQGKCSKCHRLNFKENERRTMKKNRTKDRRNQRKYKRHTQEY